MESDAPLTFAEVEDCRALTIRQLIDRYATAHPGKAFAVFPDSGLELTWLQLQKICRHLHAYLESLGAKPGDRIGMLTANGQSALELFLGCMYGGFTIATFNPVAGEAALRYVLDHSEVKVLFVDETNADAAMKICDEEMPTLKVVGTKATRPLSLPGAVELKAVCVLGNSLTNVTTVSVSVTSRTTLAGSSRPIGCSL